MSVHGSEAIVLVDMWYGLLARYPVEDFLGRIQTVSALSKLRG